MPEEDDEAAQDPTKPARRLVRDPRTGKPRWDPPEDEGGTGVREPRNPRPKAPAGAAAVEEPVGAGV